MSKADLRDVRPRPNPQAARAGSGGGIGGNKVKAVGTVAGRAGHAHPAGNAADIGKQEVRLKPRPKATAVPGVKLGNEVAKNVKGGGPGAGRTVHASGGQGHH